MRNSKLVESDIFRDLDCSYFLLECNFDLPFVSGLFELLTHFRRIECLVLCSDDKTCTRASYVV